MLKAGWSAAAPLSIALLDVCKAVPLVRQRHERLGEDLHMRCIHAQLALLGPFDASARADDVAAVNQAFQVPTKVTLGLELPDKVQVLCPLKACTAFTLLSQLDA